MTLPESQLKTTGDLNLLAKDTVTIRDNVVNSFSAETGGNLYIQGNKIVDILALNHPQTPFVSGRDLTLVSDGNISGDAHFKSGGNFSVKNLSGGAGNLFSKYDPVITSDKDISFGAYTGVALKVVSGGSIQITGDININGPDTTSINPSDQDAKVLTTLPALILRAGISPTSSDVASTNSGITVTTGQSASTPNINIKKVTTSTTAGNQKAGSIDISTTGAGTITTDNLTSTAKNDSGGDITLKTAGGTITTGNTIDASGKDNGGNIQFSGPVTVASGNNTITTSGTGNISFENTIDGSGKLTLTNETGKVTFNGNIGDQTHLGELSISNTGGTAVPAKITTKDADIIISSPITLNSITNINAGTGTIAINNSLAAGENDFTLTADQIDLTKSKSGSSGLGIDGTGKVTLQPSSPNRNINIGSSTNINKPVLDLTQSNLAAFQPNFSSITIGNNSTIGITTVVDNATFSIPLIIANPTSLGANLSNNKSIIFNKLVSLTKDVTVDTTLNGQSNDIKFNSTVDGANKLTLNAGSNQITFGDAVGKNTALNSVTITKAANIDVKSNITTINDLNLNNPVTLNDSTAQIFTSNTGNITLGKVDGAADLTLNATTAGKEVTLNDAVGGTKKLNSLTSNSTKTTIANNITTKNDITLNSPVTLKDSTAPTLTSDEGSISLSNTVDGASDLTLTASKGNVTLKDAVGGTKNLNSLTSNATQTNIGSNITTTHTQKFNSPVNLTANSTPTFTSTNSDINFQSTLDGTGNLTLTNGTGNLTFGGDIGGKNPLSGLNISKNKGTTLPANITTAKLPNTNNNGDINISSPITLTKGTSINAGTGTIAINDNLTAGAHDLTLTADEINLTKGQSISGSGNLILQPSRITQNIALGGTGDTDTSTLELTTTDLAAFQAGFNSITIGSNATTGITSVSVNASFNTPLIIANSASLSAKLSNIDKPITFQKSVSLTGNATVDAGNGSINFNKTVDETS